MVLLTTVFVSRYISSGSITATRHYEKRSLIFRFCTDALTLSLSVRCSQTTCLFFLKTLVSCSPVLTLSKSKIKHCLTFTVTSDKTFLFKTGSDFNTALDHKFIINMLLNDIKFSTDVQKKKAFSDQGKLINLH